MNFFDELSRRNLPTQVGAPLPPVADASQAQAPAAPQANPMIPTMQQLAAAPPAMTAPPASTSATPLPATPATMQGWMDARPNRSTYGDMMGWQQAQHEWRDGFRDWRHQFRGMGGGFGPMGWLQNIPGFQQFLQDNYGSIPERLRRRFGLVAPASPAAPDPAMIQQTLGG